MKPVFLKDLGMQTREEALRFLKKLWQEEETNCPFCQNRLELLHKKAKKDNSDWQCKFCDRVFRTISLFMELNEQMPK